MIWRLKTYQNYLISGDSQGNLSIWDIEFGTLIKQFNNLQADILSIAINPTFETIYATGVDSRVLSIELRRDEDANSSDWILSSIYRGQSHDIKSLILLANNTLLSGGVTTDICVYKLQDGRFKDQFGKNSAQTQF